MPRIERRGNRGDSRGEAKPEPLDVLIVGAGVFGTTGAIQLARRGHRVRLVDPGPLPHPLAASTDQSKVVRPDYGDDPLYTRLAIESIDGWRRWNAGFADGGVYHPVGFMLRTRGEMARHSFEGRSLATLGGKAWPIERVRRDALARRFPQWNAELYPDGYLDHGAGWVDAELAMKGMHAAARRAGVLISTDVAAIELLEEGGRVVGVGTAEGESLRAEIIVVATGSWTTALVPELAPIMWATGQPSVTFRVPDAHRWRPPHFVPWAADIARTGWYGFPARPDGTMKIARHGPGVRLAHGAPRVVGDEAIEDARRFIAETFPELADAPVVTTRMCAYCDTADGDFWIDRHPERPGLVVASGGSGHAFKFAPILGERIAAAVEGRPDDIEPRFRWREPKPTHEAARAT